MSWFDSDNWLGGTSFSGGFYATGGWDPSTGWVINDWGFGVNANIDYGKPITLPTHRPQGFSAKVNKDIWDNDDDYAEFWKDVDLETGEYLGNDSRWESAEFQEFWADVDLEYGLYTGHDLKWLAGNARDGGYSANQFVDYIQWSQGKGDSTSDILGELGNRGVAHPHAQVAALFGLPNNKADVESFMDSNAEFWSYYDAEKRTFSKLGTDLYGVPMVTGRSDPDATADAWGNKYTYLNHEGKKLSALLPTGELIYKGNLYYLPNMHVYTNPWTGRVTKVEYPHNYFSTLLPATVKERVDLAKGVSDKSWYAYLGSFSRDTQAGLWGKAYTPNAGTMTLSIPEYINAQQDAGQSTGWILDRLGSAGHDLIEIGDIYGIEASEVNNFLTKNQEFWSRYDKESNTFDYSDLGEKSHAPTLSGLDKSGDLITGKLVKNSADDSLFTGVLPNGTVIYEGKYKHSDNNLLPTSQSWLGSVPAVNLLVSLTEMVYDGYNSNVPFSLSEFGEITEASHLIRNIINTGLSENPLVNIITELGTGQSIGEIVETILFDTEGGVDRVIDTTQGHFASLDDKDMVDIVAYLAEMYSGQPVQKVTENISAYLRSELHVEEPAFVTRPPRVIVDAIVAIETGETTKEKLEANLGVVLPEKVSDWETVVEVKAPATWDISSEKVLSVEQVLNIGDGELGKERVIIPYGQGNGIYAGTRVYSSDDQYKSTSDTVKPAGITYIGNNLDQYIVYRDTATKEVSHLVAVSVGGTDSLTQDLIKAHDRDGALFGGTKEVAANVLLGARELADLVGLEAAAEYFDGASDYVTQSNTFTSKFRGGFKDNIDTGTSVGWLLEQSAQELPDYALSLVGGAAVAMTAALSAPLSSAIVGGLFTLEYLQSVGEIAQEANDKNLESDPLVSASFGALSAFLEKLGAGSLLGGLTAKSTVGDLVKQIDGTGYADALDDTGILRQITGWVKAVGKEVLTEEGQEALAVTGGVTLGAHYTIDELLNRAVDVAAVTAFMGSAGHASYNVLSDLPKNPDYDNSKYPTLSSVFGTDIAELRYDPVSNAVGALDIDGNLAGAYIPSAGSILTHEALNADDLSPFSAMETISLPRGLAMDNMSWDTPAFIGTDSMGFLTSATPTQSTDTANFHNELFGSTDGSNYQLTWNDDGSGYIVSSYTLEMRSADQVILLTEKLAKLEGKYDSAGYDNVTGLNSSGFNTDGFGADGFNVAGYNEFGFNAAGRNFHGATQEMIDGSVMSQALHDNWVAGTAFDADGYDINGYDTFGKNTATRTREQQAAQDLADSNAEIEAIKAPLQAEIASISAFRDHLQGKNFHKLDEDGNDVYVYPSSEVADPDAYDIDGYNYLDNNAAGESRTSVDKAEGEAAKVRIAGEILNDPDHYITRRISGLGAEITGLDSEIDSIYDGTTYNNLGFNWFGFDERGYDRDHLDKDGTYDPEAQTTVDKLATLDDINITGNIPSVNTGENESTGDGFFYNRGTGVHDDNFWVGGSHIASDVNTPDYNPSIAGFNFEEDAPKMVGNVTSPRYNADPYATLDTNTDAFKVDNISRYQPTKTATTPTATSNFSGTTFNAGNSAGRYNIDATKAATAGVKAEQRNGQFEFDEAI